MSSLSKTWITNTVHFPSSSDMTYEGQGGNSTITTIDFDSFKQLQASKVWEFVAWTTNSIVIIKLFCIYLKGCFNNGLIVDISETAPNSNRQTFFVSLTGPTTFNNSKWQRDPTRSIVLPPASVGFTHVSPDPIHGCHTSSLLFYAQRGKRKRWVCLTVAAPELHESHSLHSSAQPTPPALHRTLHSQQPALQHHVPPVFRRKHPTLTNKLFHATFRSGLVLI